MNKRYGHAVRCLPYFSGKGYPWFMAWVLLMTLSFAFAQEDSPPVKELTPAQQKAADLRLPDLDRSGLLPERRNPTDVNNKERNPFGTVAPPPKEEKEIAPLEVETEEMKIRRILGSMRVSGITGSSDTGYTVLMGPLLLRTGTTLPRLFLDQAETLHVVSVTDHDVVIAFAEKDPALPPRTLSFGINLRPRVHSVLTGELLKKVVTFDRRGAVNMEPLKSQGAEVVSQSLDKQGAASLVERNFDMMGEATFTPKDNEPLPAKSE